MNNKTLTIIFVALLAIYFGSKLFSTKRVRSFDPNIIQVDTAAVDQITIRPKGDSIPFTLSRTGASWTASRSGFSTKATSASINNLLNNLSLIKTDRISAKKKERWKEFEVDEGNASHVVASVKGKEVANVYIGLFNFNPQTRSATSYVRLSGSPEIYAVDGMTIMNLSQDFNSYRFKTLVQANSATITSLQFSGAEGSLLLSKSGTGQWQAGDGIPLDSSKVANYLGSLANISGSEFADGFAPAATPDHELKIGLSNIPEPLVVSFYASPNRPKDFAVKSSVNEAVFATDSTALFNRLIKTLNDFQ